MRRPTLKGLPGSIRLISILVVSLAVMVVPGVGIAAPSADLSVSQAASPDPVTAGLNVQFVVTVTNNGPDTATGIKLTDTFPAGATFVSMSSSQGRGCSKKPTFATCSLGGLNSGASATFTLVMTAPAAAGSITNSATASAKVSDPNPANNSSAPPTTVQPFSPNNAVGFCVAGGCSLTTDPGTGATSSNVETSTATVPPGDGGVVSLLQEDGDSSDCPGYTCFALRILITSPPRTPTDPLTFVFTIDASLLPPGKELRQVRTFHDGVLVPLCFGTSAVADPDPCVLEKIFLPDGDLQVTVLSSQNGKWRN